MSFPIHALCWTLLHSLWEGLLAAVVAGLVLLCTQRASAALRYRLLTLVFLGLVASVGATLLWELTPADTGALTGTTTVSGRSDVAFPTSVTAGTGGAYLRNAASAAPISFSAAPEPTQPWAVAAIHNIAAFCDAHALYIVSAWLLILLAKLTQTGWSLVYIRRIRRENVRPAGEHWAGKVRALAGSLGLRRSITLLESARIRVPMVVGYLKPVILVPMGILTQLPQDQLEAVLLHELAHIRRRDYLVNILQGLVEAVLFFNPAVWWISSLIREERENCCDDIAIEATRSKAQLIHALVAFQEYSLAAPQYAVAFPGRRNPLLDRVKRIVYNRNKTLNAMEKFLLSGCLLVAACLTLAFTPLGRSISVSGRDTLPPIAPVPPVAAIAPVPAISPVPAIAPVPGVPTPDAPVPAVSPIAPMPGAPVLPVPPVPAIAPVPAIDTVPTPDMTSASASEFQGPGTFRGHLDIDDGKVTYARGIWSNGDITKYFMDGKKVVQDHGVTKAFYIDGQEVPEASLDQHAAEIERIIATLREEAHKGTRMTVNRNGASQVQVYADQVSTNPNGSLSTISGDNVSASSGQGDSRTMTISGKSVSVNGGGSDVAINGTFTSGSSGNQGGTGVSVGSGTYGAADMTRNSRNPVADATEPIIADILDQHLASDPKNFSFSLDNNRMLVNNVRQPESVFQSFHKKYVLEKSDSYSYARNGDGVVSSVHQHRGNSTVSRQSSSTTN